MRWKTSQSCFMKLQLSSRRVAAYWYFMLIKLKVLCWRTICYTIFFSTSWCTPQNLNTKVHAITFQRDLCLNHCETSNHTCNVVFLPFIFLNNYKMKNHLHTLLLGHILGMWHVSTNLFHAIMDEEKKNRLHLCADLLQHAETDENFIRSVLMVSETWVNGCNVKLKQ